MLSDNWHQQLRDTLADIEAAGLTKREWEIVSSQRNRVKLADGREVLNLCANNYLGLADHPRLREAATEAIRTRGVGMASVRFICGTQDLHTELEARLSRFLGTEATILYPSCFDANGGLFETLLGPEDAVLSDELNHASIIDGIRLCKARRFRYRHRDLGHLEELLKEAREGGALNLLIATDGVFSMDGTLAPLVGLTELAERFDAMLMVDDCHATGFMGTDGRGTHEAAGVMGQVDILTGTLGKALGGASGGYTSGKQEVIDLLRQRSRPYLFSNTLASALAATGLAVLDLLEEDSSLRERVWTNTRIWREGLARLGLEVRGDGHPIAPVMVYDAPKAQQMAAALLERGVYAVGFFYPVVPKGLARIRTQISAAHTSEDLEMALQAFAEVAG